MSPHLSLTIFAIFVMFCVQPALSCAGFTALGPTPYFSAADSPFPVDGSNPNFFLEDFEDGELNTPGIFQPGAEPGRALVIGPLGIPSEFVDSVDGDDGQMDGSGSTGHSLLGRLTVVQPTDPPLNFTRIGLQFDSFVLGWLPTSFGFLWTDGAPKSGLRVTLYDEQLTEIFRYSLGGSYFVFPQSNEELGDDRRDGTTSEDRFFGFTGNIPIFGVTIESLYIGDVDTFEIDHVQYGAIVPEPSTWYLLWASLIAAGTTGRCACI